ncbi:DUF2264 domain-containing protein, partial [Deinococcus pimensis]|uniref:DUF2264 domain-containing protein n=1 Tax=Deinococcus pimensis TaxID=309888 RepID=UPI0005EB6615
EGAALPFGRSLTYRFATGAFWGALAFADVEALPWGELRGLWARHLRWWASRELFTETGVLTVGYAYPNLMISEEYNSPQSPYWAMKYFLPLALPDTHPFWQTPEAPQRSLPEVHPQHHPGMLVCRDDADGHVFALSGRQHASWLNHGAAKYAKFAYSTRFGFSVSVGERDLAKLAPDSALAFSDDGERYRVRERVDDVTVAGDVVHSLWRPWPDVTVHTVLAAAPP